MKVWKLVSGILSIILSVFVGFQSTLVGLANSLTFSKEASGFAGIIVAILLLVGGIVSIVTRNGGYSGDIALIILFGLGAVIGFLCARERFKDLAIWAAWCMICAGGAGDSIIYRAVAKKKEEEIWKSMERNPNFQQGGYGYQNHPYDPYAQQNMQRYPYPQAPRHARADIQQRYPYGQPQEELRCTAWKEGNRNQRSPHYREPYPYDPYYAPQYDIIDVDSEDMQEEYPLSDTQGTSRHKIE